MFAFLSHPQVSPCSITIDRTLKGNPRLLYLQGRTGVACMLMKNMQTRTHLQTLGIHHEWGGWDV